MPAVSGERVFALNRNHDVFALSLRDGHELWRRSTGETSPTTEGFKVTTAGDVVIAGDWDLYAYDTATGEPRWSYRPAVGYAPGHFIGDVAGTRLFTGSGSGHVYAIDTTTGREVWRREVERMTDDALVSVFEPKTNGSLVVACYTIYTSADRGGMVALDSATGEERWRYRFPTSESDPRPVYCAGGAVLSRDLAIAAAGDGRIWAVDLATGALRWSLPPLEGPFDGIITQAPQELRGLAVAGDRLIVGSLTGYLTAYDLGTQRMVWQYAQGWLGSLAWGNYTEADGVVYVPFISGFIHAVDAASGTVLWKTVDYTQNLFSPVVLAGDRVIAAGRSGVWAFPVARRPAPPAPR
jgi:outer membrane protein assembly factor BamB